MKERKNTTYTVCGTAALKPDCSRYSNENERIIDFPGTTTVSPDRVHRTGAVTVHRRKASNKALDDLLNRSELIRNARIGGLKGVPLAPTPRRAQVGYICVYLCITLAALFFGV